MKEDWVYLDTYVLQQDMRIRLPKSILANMGVAKGETFFSIFYDKKEDALVLKAQKDHTLDTPEKR